MLGRCGAAAGVVAVVMGGAAASRAGECASPLRESWCAAADSQLRSASGGTRVGPYEVKLGFAVRDSVNGQEVIASQVALTDGAVVETERSLSSGDGTLVLRQRLSPAGIELFLANTASGLTLQQDAALQIEFSNYNEVFGDPVQRAGLALAEDLSRAELPR